MTALAFLGALVAIFFVVLAIEADGDGPLKLHRPAGLFTWLTRGNWPAKIGGALIIVGVGALLRFALINLEFAPELKLSAGIVIALLLGLASMLVPEGSTKRPVSLALGGAAFGVAYLTAYSAFGIFEYLSNPMGLALLALTSVAASIFAITRSALSLALLSMVGAFLAPAFAVKDAGPLIVYGYYAAASLLTLVMVAMRGWHPLIHLSFLFTLVGGVFFAWTAHYYTEPHAVVMLPMLLLLAAVHVAMPIVERNQSRAPWLARLDLVYMLTLPTVMALLSVSISPTKVALSTELILLGGIWVLAAAGLRVMTREGVAAHAVIAGLFMVLGIAARFKNLPWELISLALGVSALSLAAWLRKPAEGLHSILAGLVLLFGAIHVLYSTAAPAEGPAFINGSFIERFLGAALLIIAGAICRRIRQPLDTLLLAVGIIWGLLSIGIEMVRWELATFALVVHWMLLLLAASLWISGRRVRIADENVTPLVVAIVATAAWSATGQLSEVAVWISVFVAPLVLIGIAVRPVMAEGDSRDQRFSAALMAPAVAVIWAVKAGLISGIQEWQFGFGIAGVFAIMALLAGSLVEKQRGDWLESAAEVFYASFSVLLAVTTLLDIARNPWAIMFEMLCLAVLIAVALTGKPAQRVTDLSRVAAIVGLALILQANIMRWLGPAGDLDIRDILSLKWPAMVSLLWAIFGSVLTIWSQKAASRTLWVGGASLLVASAIKLLLIDFGSLGQLANILAVIAAGVVFLLVGWLAPLPPAPASEPEKEPATPPVPRKPAFVDASSDASHKNSSWTLGLVVVAAVVLFSFRGQALGFMRETLFHPSRNHSEGPPHPSVEDIGQPASAAEPATVPQPELLPTQTEASAASKTAGEADLVDAAPTRPPVVAIRPSVTSSVAAVATRHDTREASLDSMQDVKNMEPGSSSEPEQKPWKVTVGANGVPTYTQTTVSRSSEDANTAPPLPLPGMQGIDQLLREGRIRRATPRDVDTWMAATGNRDRSGHHLDTIDNRSGGQYIFRTYVVVAKMTFPPEMYGGNSVNFIIPHYVQRPFGNPGHSRVFDTP